MISLLISVAVSFTVSILVTPWLIRVLRLRNIGQFIQEEVEGHSHKRGTPTMGGLGMLVAVLVGFVVAHYRLWTAGSGLSPTLRQDFTVQGWLAVFAFLGMGLIGLLDDYVKFARRDHQGLLKRWKFLGQISIAALFAWGAVAADVSTEVSFTRGTGVELGAWLYALWVLLALTATANAVNLTDGLDGLVAGSGALVFGAFVIICFWQFRHPEFYGVDGALDLGIFAAALLGAAMGFLWWNAAPARVFMGDVGSQALGGAMAALALLTNTHLLLILIGGLYVLVTASVILQVAAFRLFGRRIFRIAPLHHHFEMKGWPETTVIVRFWILAGLMVALGIGVFYGDFVTQNPGATL